MCNTSKALIPLDRFDIACLYLMGTSTFLFQATWFDVTVKKKKTIISGRLKHKFYNVRRLYITLNLIDKRVLFDDPGSDEGK